MVQAGVYYHSHLYANHDPGILINWPDKKRGPHDQQSNKNLFVLGQPMTHGFEGFHLEPYQTKEFYSVALKHFYFQFLCNPNAFDGL